ncbi:MAG: FHA domain-containing protein [Pseudomonadota bacterium]|nr:FHA domain-containing protein [Pseudomonadota bacterium]MDQ3057138.1 FHA domain-containing protein [Pseudomonadota bacterium]MDQ3229111.1 FHA domain-containing protein [Pseudomonadota bacterium]
MRVDTLSLRFPNHEHPDIPIGMGVHGVGRDPDHDRGIALVEPPHAPLVQFCVDRRGVWLNVPEGMRGVHVNGRPVQRMAMLRAGDTVHVEGIEVALAGAPVDRVVPKELTATLAADSGDQHGGDEPGSAQRVVLRGVGGTHHGRCFTLEQPRTIGRLRESDIRIDDPAVADRHARIELHGDRVLLRDLGSADGSVVNGDRVRDAVLVSGDQIVIDGHHRFVVEAPGMRRLDRDRRSNDELALDARQRQVTGESRTPLQRSVRRLPLLLAAAALLGAALSALLWFTPA